MRQPICARICFGLIGIFFVASGALTVLGVVNPLGADGSVRLALSGVLLLTAGIANIVGAKYIVARQRNA